MQDSPHKQIKILVTISIIAGVALLALAAFVFSLSGWCSTSCARIYTIIFGLSIFATSMLATAKWMSAKQSLASMYTNTIQWIILAGTFGYVAVVEGPVFWIVTIISILCVASLINILYHHKDD